MFNRSRSGQAVASALVLAAGLSAGAAQAEELSFAHFVPPQHTLTRAIIEPFANGVEEATDGALTVRVYPGGELGAGPLEQYVRVVQGVADMAWGLQGYTSSQFPKTMVAELPGVFEHGEMGYEGIWNAYDLIAGEYPRTKPLALWTSEPNVLIMKDHDIRSPADLAGLKVRVSGSAAASVIEALGATPVQMPANEMYNALQTGLIDGIVTGASAISDFKLDEVANSYTIGAPLGRITFFVVMNQDRFDGLPADQQAAIEEHSGPWLSRHGEEGWNAYADETIARLKAAENETVIELSEAQAAAFGELTLPVTKRIIAEIGAEDVLAAMQQE